MISARRRCSSPRTWRATSPARHWMSMAACSPPTCSRAGCPATTRGDASQTAGVLPPCQKEGTTMNFDFSDDLKQLRDQARRFLSEQCPPSVVRHSLDGQESYAADLWRDIGGMGWIGAAIPEELGGAGLGYEGLCVLAEEMGRAVAPVPFASTAYLAAEAILTAGSDAQRREWLPKLADGSTIACFALSEGSGNPEPDAIHARAVGGL